MYPIGETNNLSEDESSDECWFNIDAYDNILLKQKPRRRSKIYETDMKSPTIIILEEDEEEEEQEEEDVNNIEIAKVESYCDRMLTPEGNVKYKNYKILAPTNAPIRMYSPSGDIHTTPKKGKTVPKFEIKQSMLHKEKLLSLIDEDSPYCEELKAILKPTGLNRQNLEALRRTNASCLEDYLQFLNTVNYTPSPCFSMFSDDTSKYWSRPSTPGTSIVEQSKKIMFKSQSIDYDDRVRRKPIISRQTSIPNPGESCGQMCLSDELNQAERYCFRSYTPMSVGDFSECGSYSRPISSLSGYSGHRSRASDTKKAILRSFVQRNMIVRSDHRDKLAKLALAIEEDEDDEREGDSAYVSSTRLIENRVNCMLEEIKEMKDNLMDIQDSLQDDDERVCGLIVQTKQLSKELSVLRYLDNVIALLNGNLELVVVKKNWPFFSPFNGYKRDPNVNLIV